jgi:2-polyprenyl-6-hydroxyphenyl methylase/3-demethylubiquinone-9 3-methyltransferase
MAARNQLVVLGAVLGSVVLFAAVQAYRVSGSVAIHRDGSDVPAEPNAAPAVEFEWEDARLTDAHGYIRPILVQYLIDLPSGAKLLDLGSGNGALLASFRDRGWELTGVDISKSGVEIAQQRFPSINFFLADATEPITDPALVGQFDVVISTEVLEHVYNPRGLIANAYRLLKPGGQFILSTPYHGYLKNLVLALAGKGDSHYYPLFDHGHIKFWSIKTLSTAYWEAGFEDLEFHGAGRGPFLWKSMIMKGAKPLP